jgi:hypothetical protein
MSENDRFNTAYCDVCDKRPWTHTAIVCGIETFFCDACGGFEDTNEAPPTKDALEPT